MQKAAIRIVSGTAYNSHTEPLFKKLQVLPLPDLITFNKLQFLQRFTQNFLPESFNDTWVRNAIRNIGENEIQLRNSDQLQIVDSNLASLDVFPLFNFPKIWQDFPDEQVKFTRKTAEFDLKLKKYFLDDLATNIVCNRLLCPACLLPSRPSELNYLFPLISHWSTFSFLYSLLTAPLLLFCPVPNPTVYFSTFYQYTCLVESL